MEFNRLEFLIILLIVARVTPEDLDKICRLQSTIDDTIKCYDKFESQTHGWSVCSEPVESNNCFPLHKYKEFLNRHKEEPVEDYSDYSYFYYDDYYDYDDKQSDLTNKSESNTTTMGNATLISIDSDLNSTQRVEEPEIVVERVVSDDECTKTPLVVTGIFCLLGGMVVGCILTVLVLKVCRKRERIPVCFGFGKRKDHDLEHINPDSGDTSQQEEPLVNQYEALKPIPLGRPNDKPFTNRGSLHHYLSINENDNEIYENLKYQGNHVDNPIESDVRNAEEYDAYEQDTISAPRAHIDNCVTNDGSSGYIDCSGTARIGYVEFVGEKMSESESDNEHSNDNLTPMVNELKESVKRFKEACDDDESEYVQPSQDEMYMNSGEYLQDKTKDEQEIYQNT